MVLEIIYLWLHNLSSENPKNLIDLQLKIQNIPFIDFFTTYIFTLEEIKILNNYWTIYLSFILHYPFKFFFIIIIIFFLIIIIAFKENLKLSWFASLLNLAIKNNIKEKNFNNNFKSVYFEFSDIFLMLWLFLSYFYSSIFFSIGLKEDSLKIFTNCFLKSKFNIFFTQNTFKKYTINIYFLEFYFKIFLIYIFEFLKIINFFKDSLNTSELNISDQIFKDFYLLQMFYDKIYNDYLAILNKFNIFIYYYSLFVKIIKTILNPKDFADFICWHYFKFYNYILNFNIKNLINIIINKLWIILKFIIKSVIFIIKWFFISFVLTTIYFSFYYFYAHIEGTKQIFTWFFILLFFYYFMNIFNNILIKLSLGKFVTALQRFWKRTAIIFWILEIFLFFLFFYYFLNSSQEPIYFYDFNNLNQEILIQIETGIYSNIILVLSIFFCIYLLYNVNYFSFIKTYIFLIFLIFLIFFMLCFESYQFFYTLNSLNTKNWILNENFNIWDLQHEKSNFRVKQQYFIVCLLLKYWHFIFIFISWFFFFIKFIEFKKINITLLSYNLQNLIILYILNIGCLIQWIKFYFKFKFEYNYNFLHFNYNNYIDIFNEFLVFSYNYIFYILSIITFSY